MATWLNVILRLIPIATASLLSLSAGDVRAQEKVYSSGALVIAPSLQAGAPTTGAHEIGELSVDANGILWVCTGAGTPGTWAATNNSSVGAQSAPPGVVIAFAGAAAPPGYLLCNGAQVSRTTYAALFAVIGTTYGAGDGSTTFTLPDLRGEFVRGLDGGRNVDPQRTLGSAQAFNLPSHRHVVGGGWGTYGWYPEDAVSYSSWDSHAAVNRLTAPTPYEIGSEVRPRNVALNFIIAH
jgi:hypothetical protein